MAEFVYFPMVKTARALFFALGLRIDCVGSEHVPLSGGAVLAINHISYPDFIFAGVPADERGHRYVRFMAKDAVFKHPVGGPLMRGMKHISVDRTAGADAYVNAVESLRAGELVGVFPEATMSRSFDIKEFKTGAARMAADAEVPLIPIIVWGGQRILDYNHRDFSRGKAISITVGEPMYPTPADDPVVITDELRNRMIDLLDETIARYPDLPDDPEGTWWLPVRHGGSAPTPEEAAELDRQAKERRAQRKG